MAHRNRVRVAELSYCDNFGGVHPSFSRKRNLLVFGGVWHLEKFRAPTNKKKLTRKKSKKTFIFLCGFKKCVSVKNRAFFSFIGPWLPYAVRSEKQFRTQKSHKHMKFSILCCSFKQCVFVENGVIFEICFVFGPWYPLLGMRTEKT